ncbi:MAG: hypothetical protein K0B81_06680 [Candidatus Cloacimonetes bacterium]|nr:hypothetical protein [Candidatus Cloacimonadota bacterium]
MKINRVILSLLICGMLLLFPEVKVHSETNSSLIESIRLFNFEGNLPPLVSDEYIIIVDGRRAKNHNNAVLFSQVIDDSAEIERYSFHLHITPGAEGAGLALIDLEHTGDDTLSYKALSWEQPNFTGSFGLGFDVYNPRTSHWFDENGNFYGREEREISLHWDNREVFKMLSPIEFRSDPLEFDFVECDLMIRYVVAGAEISLYLKEELIIDSYFIPGMVQYHKSPVFGASIGELTTTVIIKDFEISTEGQKSEFAHLARIDLLQDEVFHAGRRNMSSTVDFQEIPEGNHRVIMTLDLGAPEGGFSAWDVGAAIFLIDSDSIRYEVCRYITPYNRGYIWEFDVSHFLPLFQDEKGLYAEVNTWEAVAEDPGEQKGWKVTTFLDFYTENQGLEPFYVENLWSGYLEYGNPEDPIENKLPEIRVAVPSEARSGRLRIVVTGHGMGPNTGGAGEFMPAERTVIINGVEFTDLLWNRDCYLNPVRPQDGTWKFDRAGWAPGSIVNAWEIDLTEFVQSSDELSLQYIPMEYLNENRGDHHPAHHLFESQIIFFK